MSPAAMAIEAVVAPKTSPRRSAQMSTARFAASPLRATSDGGGPARSGRMQNQTVSTSSPAGRPTRPR